MSPRQIAQRWTGGKTHYFDDDTLRFFGARVTFAVVLGDELHAVERLRVAWHGPHVSRAVRVTADGTVTRGPERASTRTARKDLHRVGSMT